MGKLNFHMTYEMFRLYEFTNIWVSLLCLSLNSFGDSVMQLREKRQIFQTSERDSIVPESSKDQASSGSFVTCRHNWFCSSPPKPPTTWLTRINYGAVPLGNAGQTGANPQVRHMSLGETGLTEFCLSNTN
jgi:hypothetical protein